MVLFKTITCSLTPSTGWGAAKQISFWSRSGEFWQRVAKKMELIWGAEHSFRSAKKAQANVQSPPLSRLVFFQNLWKVHIPWIRVGFSPWWCRVSSINCISWCCRVFSTLLKWLVLVRLPLDESWQRCFERFWQLGRFGGIHLWNSNWKSCFGKGNSCDVRQFWGMLHWRNMFARWSGTCLFSSYVDLASISELGSNCPFAFNCAKKWYFNFLLW